jgi:hypothetical protein
VAMIVEISVGVIALAFVVLVVFLVIAIVNATKSLKLIQKNLEHISPDVKALIHNTKELSADIKMKSESLNLIFRPLHALSYPEGHRETKHTKGRDKAAELVDCALLGVALYQKIKGTLC